MATSEGKVVDTATQPADARPRRLHRWAGGLVGTLGGLAHRFATAALLLVIVLIGARAYLSAQELGIEQDGGGCHGCSLAALPGRALTSVKGTVPSRAMPAAMRATRLRCARNRRIASGLTWIMSA